VTALLTLAMVVLVQNEGWRANKATQRKLNAIASALAEVMENAEVDDENVRQLNSAVGLEKRESSSR
jgi:low affinity Fe/Cu permease